MCFGRYVRTSKGFGSAAAAAAAAASAAAAAAAAASAAAAAHLSPCCPGLFFACRLPLD